MGGACRERKREERQEKKSKGEVLKRKWEDVRTAEVQDTGRELSLTNTRREVTHGWRCCSTWERKYRKRDSGIGGNRNIQHKKKNKQKNNNVALLVEGDIALRTTRSASKATVLGCPVPRT